MTRDRKCVQKIKITVIDDSGKESAFSMPGTMHITGEETSLWGRKEVLKEKRVEIITDDFDKVISIRFPN